MGMTIRLRMYKGRKAFVIMRLRVPDTERARRGKQYRSDIPSAFAKQEEECSRIPRKYASRQPGRFPYHLIGRPNPRNCDERSSVDPGILRPRSRAVPRCQVTFAVDRAPYFCFPQDTSHSRKSGSIAKTTKEYEARRAT